MKRLILCVALLGALVVPQSASAHPEHDCQGNGKTIPAANCALIQMNAYASTYYFAPSILGFWKKAGKHGVFHGRWRVYVPTSGGLLVPRRIKLSAKHCRGEFVIYDHRTGTVWPHGC